MPQRIKTKWQAMQLLSLSDVYQELSIDRPEFPGSGEVPPIPTPLANGDCPSNQCMAIRKNGYHPYGR
jgi:hypothetical protein